MNIAQAIRTRRWMALRWLATTVAAGVLQACATGPAYVTPTVTVPKAYKESDSNWTPAKPLDTQPRGAWWTMFSDPALDALETEVDQANHDLRAAAAHFAQARALVQGAQAAGMPQVGLGASAVESHVSADVVGRSLAGKTTSDYALPIGLSWEPDLWGRIHSEVTAAQADAQASSADLETVRLALHAELTMDYFQVRALDAEKVLLARTIDGYAADVRLTTDRLRIGIASEVDLEQAQAQLESASAQKIDLDVARSAAEHAIATLVGRAASDFSLVAYTVQPNQALTQIAKLPDVPAGLPSELLQRRPDIAAAERRVAAANARIGVAEAAFYPSLILGGSVGQESAGLSQLAALPSHFWALGPALAMTLFDGGERASRTQQGEASYAAAVESYRQRALVSFQEVEDSLAELRLLSSEATVQARARAAAEHSLSLTLDRYRVGAVSYFEVVVAQSAALTAQREALGIERRRLMASVQLVKALGGGWSIA